MAMINLYAKVLTFEVNDLNWKNLCTNYRAVRCPNLYDNFLKVFLVFILTKPDSLQSRIISYRGFYSSWKKIF